MGETGTGLDGGGVIVCEASDGAVRVEVRANVSASTMARRRVTARRVDGSRPTTTTPSCAARAQ